MILVSSISMINIDSVQNVTVIDKFINHDISPENGFIDSNNTEYYYTNDMIFDKNKIYKIKVTRNEVIERNFVKYIYQ